MKFKLTLMIMLCAIEACLGQNIPGIQHEDSILLNPLVRHGTLDNGFTYYIQHNQEPENSVEFRLVLKAGRIHEDEDQLEYAHLLEHLLVGKTNHFPDIASHFTKAGGYINAQTGTRLTIYEARIPSLDKEVVRDGIQVLRDWAQGINLDEEYIAIQRGAIEGEMRVSDPYRNWVAKSVEREVLKNSGYRIHHNYKRIENLQNFNPEAFKRFYQDWYRPNLQAAVIVGDINVDSMEYEIKRRFSDLKSPPYPKSAAQRLKSHRIHLDGSNRFTTVPDSIRQELSLRIIRLQPNFENHLKTMLEYKNMLLQQIYKLILREKARDMEQQYDPPFTSFDPAYGVNQIPDKQLDGALMDISLETKSMQSMKRSFQKSLLTWRQMHTAIELTDLERAKTLVQKNYTASNKTSSNNLINNYVDHFLYEIAAPHPEIEEILVSKILSEIKLKDIRQFILEYGNLDKNTVFIFFKGTKLNIPNHEEFEKWIEETDTMSIIPLKKEQPIHSLSNLVNLPTKNSYEKTEIMENEIGVSTIELPNGIKLVFKPTTPRVSSFSNKVKIYAFRPNTVSFQPQLEYLAASVAPEVMQYTGAGPYNGFQLEQFKLDKGITLNFRTSKDNQMIYAESKVDVVSELLNILHLYLTYPRKDYKGFDAWKREKEKQLAGMGLRGSSEFVMEKIESKWYPQVPALGMGDLQKLTQQHVFRAFNKWFSSIENFTFIVTGDFNKEELIPVLVNSLGAFPVKDKNSVASRPHFSFPLKEMKENLEFKNTDQVYVRIFFPIKVSRDIKTQIELYLLSIALNRRIYSRLREGSYSPRATGEWLDFNNGIFAFRIDFDSKPGNEERMVDYVIKEFRKLKETGVRKEWLESTISNEVRSYEDDFKSFDHSNFWQNYLKVTLQEGVDPVPGILNYGTLMQHFISLEDINTAAKNYMREENLQQFFGYPEGHLQMN